MKTERADSARWKRRGLWGVKIALLGAYLLSTNHDVFRQTLALDAWNLTRHLAVWAVAVAALLVAATVPRPAIRALWALVIGASTAVSQAFYRASGQELTLLDTITFWFARNEAYRASVFYLDATLAFGATLLAGLGVILMPPYPRSARWRTWLGRLSFLPLVPILIVAGFGFWKGRVPARMPSQFASAGVAVVAAPKILRLDFAHRRPVPWEPRESERPNIVLLVDESVRGDYLDLTPGNPFTPRLADHRDLLVDFGPAAAASNCSLETNAILRFMAERRRLTETLREGPTVWQYARKAGYRTAFIDAQTFLQRRGKLYLQHGMRYEELASIDTFFTMKGSTGYKDADLELLDHLEEALSSEQPVFVYANKIGAHVPYDGNYPAAEAVFRPTQSEIGTDTRQGRINSYRNNLRWSVDLFFAELFDRIDLTNLVLIYTADHGQIFVPGRVTHCARSGASDPRMALVPLLVAAGPPSWRERFERGALANRARASHFQIAPTVLELMGYDPDDIQSLYEATLFERAPVEPSYLNGDAFKLFSPELDWRAIDLSGDYLEPSG